MTALAVAAAVLVAGRTDRAWGAPQTPPVPSPAAPADPPAEKSLAERLRELEEANRRLLERVERLSDENRTLSNKVQQALDRDKSPAGPPADGEKGQAAARDEKKASGLGGQPPVPPEEPVTPGAGSAVARSCGARLLPNAQGVGNRYLGRVPLKAFYDYGADGVGFASADDEFLFKFRGELQVDALNFAGPPQDTVHSGFYVPRMRFHFQGRYTKPIEYQISLQRSYNNLNIFNAFLNFNYDPRLQLRVGRFKVPYTYEWYKISINRMITPDRSLFANNFGLNRMVGAMWWGQLLDDRLEYAVGVFDGPRNSIQDYNAAKDVAAFLNLRPFADRADSPLKNLNLGGSVDYGIQDNPLLPAVLTTNSSATNEPLAGTTPVSNAALPFLAFNSNVRERGVRRLWDLHLAYYFKGLSLLAAWESGVNGYAQGRREPVPLSVEGFHVTAAYFLTGETLNERTVIDPIRRFDLRHKTFGLGALEPFVRYSALTIGSDVFTAGLADPNLWTDRVQLVDVGVNWYLNRAVKVYFDWERAVFATPVYYAPGRFHSTSDLFWVRLQLYF